MKIVIALSGGLDSAVMLDGILKQFPSAQILALGFYYGSKHNPHELKAKQALISHYNGQRKEARLPPIIGETVDIREITSHFTSALLENGAEVPEGHYNEETMRLTVVPGRNMIFLSVLTGFAISIGASYIYIGVHAGDHHIYPDCRPGFINSMGAAIMQASERLTALRAPFLYETKQAIVKWGLENKVPFELTRTCYKDQPIACGRCGSCQERLEAFHLNGAEDPIMYESRELLPKSK